jgi:hypothetical protein
VLPDVGEAVLVGVDDELGAAVCVELKPKPPIDPDSAVGVPRSRARRPMHYLEGWVNEEVVVNRCCRFVANLVHRVVPQLNNSGCWAAMVRSKPGASRHAESDRGSVGFDWRRHFVLEVCRRSATSDSSNKQTKQTKRVISRNTNIIATADEDGRPDCS